MTEPLFNLPAPPRMSVPAPPADSPDTRRTRRQAEAIKHGQHPLAATLQIPLRLHTAAPANPFMRDTPGARCGSCQHRAARGGTQKTYQKCWLRGTDSDMYPRVTGGPGTDVRAWWPACLDYQPKETK
jgi:hypothetical protein